MLDAMGDSSVQERCEWWGCGVVAFFSLFGGYMERVDI